MQNAVHLFSERSLLLSSNGNMNTVSDRTRLFSPVFRPTFHLRVQKSILCEAKRRKRYGIGRSGKLVLESAYIIASKLKLLPEPLDSILREFGAGNGGRNGWNGFGWGGFDGWSGRRRTKLGMVGILVIFGVGLWLAMGKELVLDADAFLGGLGLLLFGLSIDGWKRGPKDWILGFCCCAFLVGFVLKKDDFQTWVRFIGSQKKNARRKTRPF